MSPSKRCDEILRLIDEALGDDAITSSDLAPPMLEPPVAHGPMIDCRGAIAPEWAPLGRA